MAFAHAQLDGRPRVHSIPRMVIRSQRAGQVAAALEAAWRADDAGALAAARERRLQASWHLRLALRDGDRVTGQQACDLALLADLLRRAGDFGGAQRAAERGLQAAGNFSVRALLYLQRRLATDGDATMHDLGEAFM